MFDDEHQQTTQNPHEDRSPFRMCRLRNIARIHSRRCADLAQVVTVSHLHILGGRCSSWYQVDTMM
jgi:hypothetical protein